MGMKCNPIRTVGPELVEGLPFFGRCGIQQGQGFDKLSLNGEGVAQ